MYKDNGNIVRTNNDRFKRNVALIADSEKNLKHNREVLDQELFAGRTTTTCDSTTVLNGTCFNAFRGV